MWVTCYTDASYSPQQGGGWAVWVRSDAGRIVRSGSCPDYVSNACHAELAAIFASVYLALRAWGPRVRGVEVRSDSRSALDRADPDAPLSSDPAFARLQTRLRALLARHRVRLDLRWVKGHRGEIDASAYLNTRCDRLSRAARKKNDATGTDTLSRRKRRKLKERLRRRRAKAKKAARKAAKKAAAEP